MWSPVSYWAEGRRKTSETVLVSAAAIKVDFAVSFLPGSTRELVTALNKLQTLFTL